jgi:hypothetical protein
MKAMNSSIASGRAEVNLIGQRENWSEEIREEILERLQAIVWVPLQKGAEFLMNRIPASWRDRCAQRVRKATGFIGLITPAVTMCDWSFKDCQDYLVELEMATSGALISLRLAHNNFNSNQVDHRITSLSARTKEARTMALRLRQEHLDTVMGGTCRPLRAQEDLAPGAGETRYTSTRAIGGAEDAGGVRPRGQGCLWFSGWLEDIVRYKVTWEDYVKRHYIGEPERVLVWLLYDHGLAPELRGTVAGARCLTVA